MLDYIDGSIVELILFIYLIFIIFFLVVLFSNFLKKFLRSIFGIKKRFYDE